jgi:hypothetical protein
MDHLTNLLGSFTTQTTRPFPIFLSQGNAVLYQRHAVFLTRTLRSDERGTFTISNIRQNNLVIAVPLKTVISGTV